jgi:methionyl-tRNA formyltransferase
MVVVAYGLILPQAVLDIPRLGCLNIHASLLPRWRGAAPIQRAVLAGDARTGITIMQMDAGLDTGPELLRRELEIGAQAIVEAVADYSSGVLQPRPQSSDGATYAPKLRKDEARIDWTRPAVEIDRLVRAFNPWPVAETRLDGDQVRVWQARPVGAAAGAALPGAVLDVPGRLVVATGDGALELLSLQLPGRKAVSARDLLNSRSLRGARFDSPVTA